MKYTLTHLLQEQRIRQNASRFQNLHPLYDELCNSQTQTPQDFTHTAKTWITARGRWIDQSLRQHVMPGHARVALISDTLDLRTLALPPGLLGSCTMAYLDHPEILQHRQQALQKTQTQDLAGTIYLPTDPADPSSILQSLQELTPSPRLPLIVLWIGHSTNLGVQGLETLIAGMLDLPFAQITLAFDWITTLPKALQAQLEDFGPTLPMQDTALSLWLQAQGAAQVKQDPLLRHQGHNLGFGAHATWKTHSK